MIKGKVAIVGAGPGHPDLLTVRAHKILTEARVVLYDRLITPGIMAILPKGCTLISVGKTPEKPSISQEEIHALLLEYANKGGGVVRLKSGDPFLFGRGSEEALYLQKHGIPFEIVPGVSSAMAAPAIYGIPLTHRGTSQALVVVTGQEAEGKPIEFDWAAVVKIDTIVILMGVRTRQRIAKRLIELGRTPDDPVAFIENACRENQNLIISTLQSVSEEPPYVQSPAVTVIGPVVDLHAILYPS